MSGDAPLQSKITFVEYDEPALQAGRYRLDVTQSVRIEGVEVSPSVPEASLLFAVTGERFSFDSTVIHSIFPADMATGEFSKVLPHVIFDRPTLPWERSLGGKAAANVPWLALLLVNEDEMPHVKITTQSSAQKLISPSKSISIYNAQGEPEDTKTKGALPDHYLSYPDFSSPDKIQLDYGELPSTACTTLDIPVPLFNQIAPSLNDLSYLAHIREVDTMNSEDQAEQTLKRSIVICNRLSKSNTNSHVFLVSLEEMGPYLPGDDGSSHVPSGKETIRLIAYRSWKFFAEANDQILEHLLENLVPKKGAPGVSSLQYEAGTPPSSSEVQAALVNQAAGKLTDKNANDLLGNAFGLGYLPLPHHMRHGGQSVSWYRGPLVPYQVAHDAKPPFFSPDGANRYNPQTGMFDVSYGAAWQLGQLLALQNANFSTALYNWKAAVSESDALAEEHSLLEQKLMGAPSLEHVLAKRQERLKTAPAPDTVVTWIAKLKLLEGVPFNYLVPHESMLPPESLRLFFVDPNWITALVDGAFSIGRTTKEDVHKDAKHLHALNAAIHQKMKELRPNLRPSSPKAEGAQSEVITGLLIRSKAVSGWPRLIINGYEADAPPESACVKYKMTRLAPDVMLCLFEGNVAVVDIHEPPEQLHFGVEEIEGHRGLLTTGLRVLTPHTYPPQAPLNPGQQLPYQTGTAPLVISTRGDGQTIKIANAAANICETLNTVYKQEVVLGTTFTSAEFAIQMVKGVVQVEFHLDATHLNRPSTHKKSFSYAK